MIFKDNAVFRSPSRRCGNGNSNRHLPDVMGNAAENTADPKLIFFQDAQDQRHAQEAEQTAGEGIEHRHRLTDKEVSQNNAKKHDRKRLFPAEDGEGKDGYDVGQSQLQTGDGKR